MDQNNFPTFKDWVELLAHFVSAGALLIGGVLAWRRWGKEAPQAPRGELSHEVVHRLLSASVRLIHVSLMIKNTGKVTLTPILAYTFVQRITPLEDEFVGKLPSGTLPKDPDTKTEFKWPLIGKRIEYPVKKDQLRIDSGETEKLYAEFLIPSSVSAVFVYSLACMDPDDPDLGWDVTTFHLIDGSEGTEEHDKLNQQMQPIAPKTGSG
jgi:hypothetical protein